MSTGLFTSQVAGGRAKTRSSRRDVVRLLTLEDALAQLAVGEDRLGELSVERAVEAAVEDLLNEVKDDVVQEVVPRVLEEEALRAVTVNEESLASGSVIEGKGRTSMVGMTPCSRNLLLSSGPGGSGTAGSCRDATE